ncbi:hypothetical protein D9M68_243220 [compost metagenome]
MGVLQLDELLQFVQLALQVLHAVLQFVILATGGIEAFLGDRQFVGYRLAALAALFGAALLGVAGLAGNQAQAVLNLSLGRRRASAGALRRIELARTANRQVAAFAPCGILFRHLGQRLVLRTGPDLLLVRQAQHLAALQAVDVAAEEGIGIEVLDGQHGLVHGHAAVRTGAGSDLPQRVTRSHAVLAAGQGRLRLAGRTARRRRCGARRYRSRTRSRSWRRHCDRSTRHRSGNLRGIERRIEQHGVFAEQAPAGPEHLHQEIQVGFLHGPVGGDANDAAAIRLDHRREAQAGQEVLAVDASPVELLGRSELGNHLARRKVAHFQQVDLGIQRLVERRIQVDVSQPQRVRHASGQCRSSRDRLHQFTKPDHSLIPSSNSFFWVREMRFGKLKHTISAAHAEISSPFQPPAKPASSS